MKHINAYFLILLLFTCHTNTLFSAQQICQFICKAGDPISPVPISLTIPTAMKVEVIGLLGLVGSVKMAYSGIQDLRNCPSDNRYHAINNNDHINAQDPVTRRKNGLLQLGVGVTGTLFSVASLIAAPIIFK